VVVGAAGGGVDDAVVVLTFGRFRLGAVVAGVCEEPLPAWTSATASPAPAAASTATASVASTPREGRRRRAAGPTWSGVVGESRVPASARTSAAPSGGRA